MKGKTLIQYFQDMPWHRFKQWYLSLILQSGWSECYFDNLKTASDFFINEILNKQPLTK